MKAKARSGFTLVELMIAVAVVGILAAIAYPSYTQYVRKANRAAAEGFMLDLANKQEQFMLDKRRYFCTTTPGGCANTATVSNASGANYTVPNQVAKNYTIEVAASDTATPLTFTITAKPIAGTAQASDTKCANLTLDQTGAKGQSGAGTVADCW